MTSKTLQITRAVGEATGLAPHEIAVMVAGTALASAFLGFLHGVDGLIEARH